MIPEKSSSSGHMDKGISVLKLEMMNSISMSMEQFHSYISSPMEERRFLTPSW